jgi:hypothetical protein
METSFFGQNVAKQKIQLFSALPHFGQKETIAMT